MEWGARQSDLAIGTDFADDNDIDSARESCRVDTRVYRSMTTIALRQGDKLTVIVRLGEILHGRTSGQEASARYDGLCIRR